ncbi:hypothetical protein NPIL_569091 [Nephila pilipes]|uniref:Reverse transcriptase n=1 Tax=Nephila pilipes TaxID=299642 RepID=A0A8X6N337_NEPPI|nr:hypothetical protein NPIL_569091 [Nephila pilipes]
MYWLSDGEHPANYLPCSRNSANHPLFGVVLTEALKEENLGYPPPISAIYKQILPPALLYGNPIWGTTKKINYKMLQTFQTLWNIVKAPIWMLLHTLHDDLKTPSLRME